VCRRCTPCLSLVGPTQRAFLRASSPPGYGRSGSDGDRGWTVRKREWTSNHWRWVVWKLACMERRFPQQLGNKLLTPHHVFHQILYRYHCVVSACSAIHQPIDSMVIMVMMCVCVLLTTMGRYEREVNRAQRSALKIILERDESSSRFMVLCVASIKSYGLESPQPAATDGNTNGILNHNSSSLAHGIVRGRGRSKGQWRRYH